jgi:hypothetical protein
MTIEALLARAQRAKEMNLAGLRRLNLVKLPVFAGPETLFFRNSY